MVAAGMRDPHLGTQPPARRVRGRAVLSPLSHPLTTLVERSSTSPPGRRLS